MPADLDSASTHERRRQPSFDGGKLADLDQANALRRLRDCRQRRLAPQEVNDDIGTGQRPRKVVDRVELHCRVRAQLGRARQPIGVAAARPAPSTAC